MAAAAEAPKPPPALAPFAGKNPPPAAGEPEEEPENGKPPVVAGLVGSAPGEDADEPDEPPAAKAERAEWRRFALKRFAKSRHADLFECRAIPEPEAGAIRKALGAATSRDDVAQAFEKAKKRTLTTQVKAKAVGQIKTAAKKWFEAEYGAAMKTAREKLAGNVDEA